MAENTTEAEHGATPVLGGEVDALRERLAEYAHAAWSGWMHYLFTMSDPHDDGSVTIPETFVTRWTRQAGTRYEDLSANEQWSDQLEADKMLALLGVQVKASRMQCIRCGAEGVPSSRDWRFDGTLWEHECPHAPEGAYPGVGVPTELYGNKRPEALPHRRVEGVQGDV